MKAWQAGTIVMALLAAGCAGQGEPREQWLVTLSTDAPIPQLGDVLLVELLRDDGSQCNTCRRLIAVAEPSDWPVSFGLLPADVGVTRVRARLYRTVYTGLDGLPAGPSLIDAVGRLPKLADGVTDAGLELRMSCFGLPADVAQGLSCNQEGELAPERVLDASATLEVGSWPLAERQPCAAAVPEDMVCVEGGVFLLGSPDFVPTGYDVVGDPIPEHLVKLSPYALDREELTVAAARKLVEEGDINLSVALDEACNYRGPTDTSNDALPLNCVTKQVARAICAARERRLPREAEWEFAAGNETAETTYPWGQAPEVCAHAIVARGRDGMVYEQRQCRDQDPALPAGSQAGGHELDRTSLGIANMAGNVAEWLEDDFAKYTDPCWSGGGPLLVNPVCVVGDAALPAVRGSSWTTPPFLARVSQRAFAADTAGHAGLGVRCAVDAGP